MVYAYTVKNVSGLSHVYSAGNSCLVVDVEDISGIVVVRLINKPLDKVRRLIGDGPTVKIDFTDSEKVKKEGLTNILDYLKQSVDDDDLSHYLFHKEFGSSGGKRLVLSGTSLVFNLLNNQIDVNKIR